MAMAKAEDAARHGLTLSIVQLERSIDRIDHSPSDTIALLLGQCSCSTPPGARLALEKPPDLLLEASPSADARPSRALVAKVEKSVVRFFRDNDRWTALASLLMKSVAFYRSLDPRFGLLPGRARWDGLAPLAEKLREVERWLPIVDLPRTKENRPFLPRVGSGTSNGSSPGENENLDSAMNVSHQYPWVCMAQRRPGPSKGNPIPHKLGVDLVVFEARFNKYTPTITDFLCNFENSFTPWEWDRVNKTQSLSIWGFTNERPRNDESSLREFYLRWSMKEAYTKALGVGMAIGFDEFETRLVGVDDGSRALVDDGQEDGIWASIMKRESSKVEIGQLQLSVVGKVNRFKLASPELWEFIFIPLGDDDPSTSQGSIPRKMANVEVSGLDACACICRGPMGRESPGDSIAIEMLTVLDLIQMHSWG